MGNLWWPAALLGLLISTACGGSSPQTRPQEAGEQGQARPQPPAPAAKEEPAPLADEAVAGVENQDLRALFRSHWDWRMRQSPVWATTLGDHRFDGELAPASHADVEDARGQTRLFLSQARALTQRDLSRADQISLALFIEDLEADVASEVCDFHLWSVSTFGNAATRFNSLPERHKIGSKEDAENLLARYRKIAHVIGDSIDNLRLGLERDLAGSKESVRRTIAMIDRQLEKPVAEWALTRPARAAEEFEGWTIEERERFARDLESLVSGSIKPAVASYREVLANEVLPKARGKKEVGLGALPQGTACYQSRIRAYTGLELTAKELHELGIAEIDRINQEMRRLGKKLFGTGRMSRITSRLRKDPALYFEEPEAIVEAAETALAAAEAKVPEFFGIQPQAECKVVEIPDYEAPYSTIAYYRGPHFDGSKPGEYFINTYKPEVRPRFEMEVLAYHEAVPGHHLQIAISQERGELPAFRRFGGNTAFVEGWALYAERLAEEMGLYSGDLDRIGMLSYDAWRASRLVVDTGIHSMGWTRERAEAYMKKHTALTEANIANEVDRYIAWPGQALAYKVGQLEILKVREVARDALGESFDIKAFHDAVLRNGAVTLPLLRDEIGRWIQEQQPE